MTKFLTGWGVSGDVCSKVQTYPDHLQELDVQILPQNTCRMFSGYYNAYNKTLNKCVQEYYSYQGPNQIISHVMCAKHPEKGRATCHGDSGGPLTVIKNGRHVLVGITSGGFGCGLVSFLLDIFFQLFWDKGLGQITSYPLCKARPKLPAPDRLSLVLIPAFPHPPGLPPTAQSLQEPEFGQHRSRG